MPHQGRKVQTNMEENKAEVTIVDSDLDEIFGGETDFPEEAKSPEEGATEEEFADDDYEEADIEDKAEDTTPEATDDVKAEPEEQPEETEKVENYQFINAKVNHEDVQYDLSIPEQRDTVIRNIQKGMDYDRVKAQVAKLEAESGELKYLKESLEAIKGEFANGYELLDDALANVLVESEAKNGRTLERDEALKRVKANRENVFTQAERNEEQLKQKSIEQFANLYPDVRPESIPKEVWDEFTETSDLVGSYRKYESGKRESEFETLKKELESTKAELETLKLNEKNRQRSTGNRNTSGKTSISSADKILDDIFGTW